MKPKRAKSKQFIDWRGSKARQILLDDLRSGKIPLNAKLMTGKEAFEIYKVLPAFQKVVLKQFTSRLYDHRKQVIKEGTTGKRRRNEDVDDCASGQEHRPRRKKKPKTKKERKNINWRGSKAQVILNDHLERDLLVNEKTAEEAFEEYKDMEQFEEVCFTQFERMLRNGRKKWNAQRRKSAAHERALEHDRQLHPVQLQDSFGRERFFLNEGTVELLDDDLKAGRHKDEHGTHRIQTLWKSREEYKKYDCGYFKQCVKTQSTRLDF